ncbi:DegQ family serine endoprotease [Hyphobacterium marinum]|uniref:DegQ family serine endoprotease n=1 Tax=Hyphobacterium marinum TaxID=3116574 RepID=A0ABU7LZD1_9PROT|nr:DegQ family serine endoprotease [Hyphobacterium sp. Y6023]MEE2566916.1 DegQ family serine endoprotease [Hyphobacterium sp. Y6023]
MTRLALIAATSLAVLLTSSCEAQEPESPALAGSAQETETLAEPSFRTVPESQTQMQLSFAPIVREVAPAVVNVYSSRVVQRPAMDPFFERFFGRQGPRSQTQSSLGSGVIIDPSGVIITNNHVVQGATELRVVLNDRREFEAEILLADERTDLAVLRIETDVPLPSVPYAQPGAAEIGDLVLAIGNPFGVGQTVTSGIVSALARTEVGVSDFAFFIQTDAAINPGNSGGALVNMDGALIGVNSAIYSRSGGSNGIGFAIPIEMVRRVVDAALTEGELIQPWLGARLQTVTGDIAASLDLDRPRGALVSDIYPGAAAEEAGLERGDIVLAIDGVDVNDEPGARFRYATRAVGDTADFTVLRDGGERTIRVPVDVAPSDPAPERRQIAGRNPLAGAEVANLSPAFNEEIGFDPFVRGVIVLSVQRGSAADYFGFRPGDRVLELQGAPVTTVDQLTDTVERDDDVKDWPIAIERRGQRMERTLQL